MDNSKNVNFQNVKDSGCSCRVVEQVLAVALRREQGSGIEQNARELQLGV